ncbi:hypothetical protein A1O7_02550 [Cladophialophora yegresii CBS 114405]|uniref:Zn(2)-C6 fungal-type domain-containing protein n=1 Tax=Cladophialophora yegresii CBS 114405 TaxID=1182544 RepID=W9W218_9EURO|nr:uncharacterized protein A1O7_02550 [Cladophialophora yegresii CBS 114405]EXJ62117.1 hypothetical protein A1O7_02550 [Cladophialophora yegresii CBS 114405]
MAAPSTVLRRSQGKSKNGCKTCVGRRIRCDQAKPACQKCTRSGRECIYASVPGEALSEHATSMAWLDDIDGSCQAWRDTGETPFPILMVPSSLDWHGLDARGLRYFYYIASLGDVLDRNNSRHFCLWWMGYDLGLQMAASIDYVAYAHILVAANRLGRVTKLASVMEDAQHYQGLAIKGLRRALASFSKENADAVLGASISLMNQQQTPAEWQRVTQGTAAVIKAMGPAWIKTSSHWPVLKHIYHATESTTVVKSEPSADPKTTCPMVTVQSVGAAVEFLLDQGVTALNRLATCTRARKELCTTARGLADMLRLAHAKHQAGQKHDPFWLAHPFCELTNREAISFTDIHASNPFVLVILAHMYSALVVLSMLYPELDTAWFIGIRLHSLDGLARYFRTVAAIDCEVCREAHNSHELLAFPCNAMQAYRQWRRDQHSVLSQEGHCESLVGVDHKQSISAPVWKCHP